MATKRYLKESDFTINFRLKKRIRELLQNMVTIKTVALLANEVSELKYEEKEEIVEYINFVRNQLKAKDPGLTAGYASKTMEKRGEINRNEFYIAQMKKNILEMGKKASEGFYLENNYLSSNAIFSDDIEDGLNEITKEFETKIASEEIHPRYILDEDLYKATNQNKFKRPERSEINKNINSIKETNDTKKIDELLRKKEESERKEFEKIRKEQARLRAFQEEQEKPKKKR